MQNQRKTSPKSQHFALCKEIVIGGMTDVQTLYRKFTISRFCACEVKILLKVVGRKCNRVTSIFEALCGISYTDIQGMRKDISSTVNRSRDFAHAQKLIRPLTLRRTPVTRFAD